MYEWFTPTCVLKDVYKEYVEEGSSHFQRGIQNCPILEVEQLILTSLKAHRKVGQHLYARTVRNLIILIIKKKKTSITAPTR